MKKILEIFTKDPGLKLAALVISIGIWFVVMNVVNPVTTKDFDVTLSLRNTNLLLDNDKVLNNERELLSKTITIKLSGEKNTLEALENNTAGLSAYVDFLKDELLNAKQVDYAIQTQVRVVLPAEYQNKLELVRVTPDNVDVRLDNWITKTYNISLNVIGDGAEGYVKLDEDVSPKTVELTGPQGVLSMIGSVRAELDITDAKDDVSRTVTLQLYGIDGEKYRQSADVSMSINTAQIYASIGREATIPISSPVLEGTPAENYVVTKVELSPEVFTVIGYESDIANFKAFELYPIDITGINTTRPYKQDLRSQLNQTQLKSPYGASYEVTVTITVEKLIEKEFEIPADMIELLGFDGNIELISESVTLTLRGLESEIAQITEADIIAAADLSGLAAGSHGVRVVFTLPERFAAVSIVAEEAAIELVLTESEEQL